MKELSIEEKAKAYDEAIEKAKIWQAHLYDVSDKDYADELNYIFPELKESEDEQHRKWIIEYLYYGLRKSDEQFKGQFKSAIAWLEKQGEQKVANKVEPKFHEGDWVIDKQGIAHQIANVVENVTCHTYGYNIVGGGYFNDNTEGIRLWTIQDAKDGDVLASKGGEDILIFRNLDTNTSFSSYYNIPGKGEIGWSNSSFIPATKEQQDLLFSKMKEAGYKLDKDFNLIKI